MAMPPKSLRHKKRKTQGSDGRTGTVNRSTARGPVDVRDTEAIVIAASTYIVRHYPIGHLGGTLRSLELGGRELWIVPIILTSPGYGPVGEVGVVAVDPHTSRVVGSTARAEVVAAAQRLREEKHDDLEAAFRRARTV